MASEEAEDDLRDRFPSRPWIRMVRAADREGPLFTIQDLKSALKWGGLEESMRPLMHELTREPVDAPDKTWPEDLLILIALAVEERRERIRMHLKFSAEGMASALERVRSSLPQTGEAVVPNANAVNARRVEHLVSAADDEGELFTAAELLNALRRTDTEEDAQQLAADWTEGGIDGPGIAWTENVLVLIAFTIPDRAERIRRHLGYSEDRMVRELESLRLRYPPR